MWPVCLGSRPHSQGPAGAGRPGSRRSCTQTNRNLPGRISVSRRATGADPLPKQGSTCMSLTASAVRAAAAIAMTSAVTLLPGTALAAPGGHTGSGTPVPASFKANSVTWVSAQKGWVLGAARCGKTCSDVIGTSNGGKKWQLIGTVKAPISNLGKGTPGVTEIRFSTPAVGWAFGQFLFRTSNGGKSWARMPVPGGGKQVLALAAN